jgi:hypothetical protein
MSTLSAVAGSSYMPYAPMIGTSQLPPGAVSRREKQSLKYRKAVMDFFDYQSMQQQWDKVRLWKNYQYINGQVDKADYKDFDDPLSMGAQKAELYGDTMDITHFPIASRPVQVILGEMIKRPLNFYVRNESSSARNEFIRSKSEMLQEGVMLAINARIAEKYGLDQEAKDYREQLKAYTPDKVQQYHDRDWVDVGESVGNRIMVNLRKRENLDDTFLEGFKHATIAACEAYHIRTINKKTRINDISPLDLFYHKSPSQRWISKSQYAGYRLYLTPSSIIDWFYDKLTKEDLDKIMNKIYPNQGKMSVGAHGAITYNTNSLSDGQGIIAPVYHDMQTVDQMLHDWKMNAGMPSLMQTAGLIKVVIAYYKSQELVYFLHRPDANGIDQVVDVVDENYEPDELIGEWVKPQPINRIYEGTKIGDDIYLELKPYTDYPLDIDNLDDVPLPIEGCCYNDTHSQPISIVDMCRQWNVLYDIVAHELKRDLRTALGKVLLMSLDHMPDTPGFSKEKWMHWLREMRIMWVKQPSRGSASMFNQFNAIDASFAEQITAKMNMLERIKMECDSIAGFSPQRIAGSNGASSTLGEANQQLLSSVNQTEYFFFKHSQLIQKVLNYALNLEQKNAKVYGTLRNLMDDMENAYIDEAHIDKFCNSKIGLYVTNSLEDLQAKQRLDTLTNLAVSNGADIADVSEAVLARSVSEIQNIYERLRRMRKEAAAIEQQQKQAELELKKYEADQQNKIIMKMHDDKMQNNKDVAYIKTFAMQEDNMKDTDANGQPDILEYQKLWQEHNIKAQDLEIKRRKQFSDERYNAEDINVRKMDVEAKKYVADKQLAVAKENKPARPAAKK